MSKNIGLFLVLVGVVTLVLVFTVSSFLDYLQTWLAAEHPVSGLVLVIGAFVLVIGTKVLWK